MSNTTNVSMLKYALTSAKYEKKTGNLHVITSLNGSLKTALLVVSSGELIGCSYLDKVGKSAVRVLLQAEVVKATFIQRDISSFTPQLEMPSIEGILRKLRSSQSVRSAVQPSTQYFTPLERPKGTGNLRRAAVFLANVVGEDKAKLLVLEISKRLSPDDDADEFIDTCIDLAASSVGDLTARMLFQEITSTGSGISKAKIAKDNHVAALG